jgi:thiamine biosynthesis lipoprotein
MSELLTKKTYQVMGGEFQFLCFPQTYHSKADVEEIFHKGYLEVKRIEDKFTDFKDSYFNRINQNAGVTSTLIDDETLWIIKKSLEISKKSSGVFDITFASIGHYWREKKTSGQVLSQEFIKSKLKFINYNLIELDEAEKKIYLPNPEIKIGLGGIGKGYAVDRVFELFLKEGLTNFYVNGAGDLRVHSRADAPRAWRIGIRNPLSVNVVRNVGIIQLANGSVASSGGYIHNVNGDRFNNHIIDPKSGLSAQNIIGTTVLADDALTTDTTATILMNLSVEEALNYLNNNLMMGIVFSKEGKSYLSEKALDHFGSALEIR